MRQMLIIGVIAAAILTGACGGDGQSTLVGGTATERFPGDLLTSSRTHLSLCVDQAGASPREPTTGDVERVSKAVTDALATLHPLPPEFGKPSVSAGCPAPIPLTGARLGYEQTCAVCPARVFTDAAQLSPHRIFAYFVPDTMYALSFGDDEPYTMSTAESLCEGGGRSRSDTTCGGMTASIYAPDSITDGDLAHAVLKSLGLAPITPQPPIDWASCTLGTPRPECDRYLYCLSAPTEDQICKDFWQKARITPPPR